VGWGEGACEDDWRPALVVKKTAVRGGGAGAQRDSITLN